MDSFQFKVNEYGIFDSSIHFPNVAVTNYRPVNQYEIELFTVDCEGSTFIEKKEYPLKCGTLICAKPGRKRRSRLHFRCYYVHLTTDSPRLKKFLDAIPDYINLPDLSEPTRLFHEMLRIQAENNDIENSLLLQSIVCRLLAFIGNLSRAFTANISSSVYIHQKMLLNIEKEIRENPSGDFSLEALSKKSNLSPVYFHKIFTEYFGKTPSKYVFDCRIAAAKVALVTQSNPISEIANSCGFSSQSYFNYKFKEAVGKSPLQYRKIMLNRKQI